MAIPHAQSGEVVDVHPLGPALATARTTTLVKSKTLEILRLVVPAGKEIPSHQVAGEVTLLCLEGTVGIPVDGDTRVLEAGQLLYLAGHESMLSAGFRTLRSSSQSCSANPKMPPLSMPWQGPPQTPRARVAHIQGGRQWPTRASTSF
jgi:hypothetical protein